MLACGWCFSGQNDLRIHPELVTQWRFTGACCPLLGKNGCDGKEKQEG